MDADFCGQIRAAVAADRETAFWGAEKAKAWCKHFEDAGITQSPQNYLSLNHQIHFWFDNARFALKPLRHTPNEVVVQWHWLKRSALLPRTEIGQAQDAFLALAGLNDMTWGLCLAHRRSGVPIQTGQTFVIRAEKPEDLPSFELLEVQWNLLRVAAICGAANVIDASYYDLDDDEVAHLVVSGRDEIVTTGQNEVVTEAPEGSESGSPSEQIEQTLPHHHQTHAAKAFRNG
ncbi:fee270ed-584f-4a31-8c5c-59839a31ac0b [Thermothielavioides terrestris]|uniref:Fee270ed-584f-4a31-8c5c-59839a31ac0b n=1 Tax=Thermothielavioides terrestris TaxID=2587410 RepID=A0A3S4AZR2_9PEZI|nr:fee270ed-584f-4a31-8c5c-59839a31ac0b [Thermothielavioides terrestris]